MDDLLTAARSGDERAFAELVEPYRRELHAHCYRLLGSVQDAEDVLQESLLRAWKAIGRFDGRYSVRPWLYRIATNRCLTALESRRTPLPWVDPYPDVLDPEARTMARESVELAFVTALQELSPLQRAVLVLREVLEFPAREVADLLDTSVPAVNSALQRARAVVRRPERSQQAELSALGPGVRELAARYAAAWEAADVEGVVALLAEDVRLAMPHAVCWGVPAVREALLAEPLTYRWRFVPVVASAQLAFACYRWDGDAYIGEGLNVLTLRDGRVAAITAFRLPTLQPYGLPPVLR